MGYSPSPPDADAAYREVAGRLAVNTEVRVDDAASWFGDHGFSTSTTPYRAGTFAHLHADTTT
jgi:hypothetical protein